jgi:hypothetical protein
VRRMVLATSSSLVVPSPSSPVQRSRLCASVAAPARRRWRQTCLTGSAVGQRRL